MIPPRQNTCRPRSGFGGTVAYRARHAPQSNDRQASREPQADRSSIRGHRLQRQAVHSTKSFSTAPAAVFAAACSQSAGRAAKSPFIRTKVSSCAAWMAQIRTHRGQKVGSELCAGSRAQFNLARISRDPAKHKPVLYGQNGSGDRNVPVARSRKHGCECNTPCAQSQADGTRTFASRTIRPPRHFAIAT
jgi:hypothetical protein